MKVLLIYPKYPETYWSFSHALRFISKKAAVPPLGLVTVSALLPDYWERKLIDMNVEPLKDSDLEWADYIFISAMYVQKASVHDVLKQTEKLNKPIVAGGPLFTQEYSNYPQINHFILNESEITMPQFLDDLISNKPLKKVYNTEDFANIQESPIPHFHLLKKKDYAFMNIQVSRGCPFACDFCEITSLLGHKVRLKTVNQVLNELDALYDINWRGHVFIVDDNFIGNKKFVRDELLPAMYKWAKEHKFPFTFNTQTSIDLADDKEILDLMVKTGFDSTFIGIETPDENALTACNKVQNNNRDMVESVHAIQKAGLQVSGGFIVGFDSDSSSIFNSQIEFIKKSGIVSAMVGLLNAPKNTKLYERMEAENRLTEDATGDNTDMTMNFVPKMDKELLQEGYNNILQSIYEIKPYYQRIRQFLKHYNKTSGNFGYLDKNKILAFFKTIFIMGIKEKGRGEYWKLLFWSLFHKPSAFVHVMTLVVYGYHFRNIFNVR